MDKPHSTRSLLQRGNELRERAELDEFKFGTSRQQKGAAEKDPKAPAKKKRGFGSSSSQRRNAMRGHSKKKMREVFDAGFRADLYEIAGI